MNSIAITAILQQAMVPAFLLVGLGQLLNVYSLRLARIVDRSRVLETAYRETIDAEHKIVVEELRDLQQRIHIVNSAIGFGVASGIMICLLIGTLFIAGLTALGDAAKLWVAAAFILLVLLLATSLIQFLREVRIAIRDIRIREEYLEKNP
jgi:hypothetical protein